MVQGRPRLVAGESDTARWPLRWQGELTDQKPRFIGEGGGRHWLIDGIRSQARPGYQSRFSKERFSLPGVVTFAVPERLGGGFLFALRTGDSTSLWFSRDWTGPLEAVVRFRGGIDWLRAGFDQIYLRESLTGRLLGLDAAPWRLGPARALPTAATYGEVAIIDEFFGAISGEPFGTRLTFDAGTSWVPLGPSLPEPVRLERAGALLHVRSGAASLWIDANGNVSDSPPGPDEANQTAPDHPPMLALQNPAREAVLHGFPHAHGRALVASAGHVAEVDLATGSILQLALNQYPGRAACTPFRWGTGVGFACGEAHQGTTLYAARPDLTLDAVHSWPQPRRVLPNGSGQLLVIGGCAAGTALASGMYCQARPDGSTLEFSVRDDSGLSRAFLVSDGVLGVLAPPRPGAAGELLTMAGKRLSRHRLSFADKKTRARAVRGLWLADITVQSDRSFGSWIVFDGAYAGVTFDLEGHVVLHSAGPRDIKNSALFGRTAAYFDPTTGVISETNDFSKTWSKVGDFPYVRRAAILDALQDVPEVGCSAVGCSFGPFQHFGFDAQPAEAEREIATAPEPPETNINPTFYDGWRFACAPHPSAATNAQVLPRRVPPSAGARVGFDAASLPSQPLNPGSEWPLFEPWPAFPAPPSHEPIRFQKSGRTNAMYRAFLWGGSDKTFRARSGWTVHVRDGFSTDRDWMTATTIAPWVTAEQGHAIFGSTGSQAARWELEPAASGAGALLLTGTGEAAQLHVLEPSQPIQSFAQAGLRSLAGAARYDGKWFTGQQDGESFSIVRVDPTGPTEVRRLQLGIVTNRAELVGTSDESQLGVLVHALTGAWFLYPLDPELQPLTVLAYPRETLGDKPLTCEGPERGFVVTSSVPPSRAEPPPNAPVRFDGIDVTLHAEQLRARLRLHPGSICVEALAASTRRLPRSEPTSPPGVKEGPFSLQLAAEQPAETMRFQCRVD